MIDPDTLALLAAIQDLTGITANLLSITNSLKQQLMRTAVETSPFEIENTADQIQNEVTDATTGLANIYSVIIANQATLTTQLDDIETAIGSPAQAGVPVTLDTGNTQYISDAVWLQHPTGYPDNMGDGVVQIAQATAYQSYFTLPYSIGHFYLNAVRFGTNKFFPDAYNTPSWNVGDLLDTDTLLAFMTRTNPDWTCSYQYDPQTNVILVDNLGGGVNWVTDMDEPQFLAYLLTIFPLGSVGAAPVWPGLGNVTLGTPLDLVDGLVITGPLQGVLIEITAVAYPTSYYPFGDIKSYSRAGALVFTTDRGDSEFPQPFGPENEIMLPKTMAEAAGATCRVTSGVVGTATPFTIP